MTAPVVVGSHHDVSAPIRAGHRRVHRASHPRWRAFSEREHGTSASTRIFHPRTTRCHPGRRRRRSPTAMAVADGGGSALDLLVSGGVLIALGQAGVRAIPALTLTDAANPISLPEPEEGDDMGLRWGVAGVVSAIPLVGFVSFLLPALGFDEEKDEDDAARLKLLSAVFAVASLSQGLNLGSAGAWGVAAACAATLQLERLGRESRVLEAQIAKQSAAAEKRRRTRELNAAKARTVSDAVERAGKLQLAKEEKEETPGQGGGNALWNVLTRTSNDKTNIAGDKNSWAGGSDPLPRGAVPRVPSIPRLQPPAQVPEVLTVKQLGRALGAARVNATRFKGEMEEGKLRALLDAESEDEAERLELEGRYQSTEMEAWDARFEVRTATREQLMAIARERGMRGYSKLRRAELLEAVERELYGDREEDLSP